MIALRESRKSVKTCLKFTADAQVSDFGVSYLNILGQQPVEGSFHQGDPTIFGEYSVGRQCMCNSFIAICQNNIIPCRAWNSGTLDLILLEGDMLYNNILPTKDYRPDYLLVTELPVNFKFSNRQFCICTEKSVVGLVDCASDFMTLEDALDCQLSLSQSCIVTLKQYTIAVFKHSNGFSVFDSHSRDSSGLSSPNGLSVLVHHGSLDQLSTFLRRLAVSIGVKADDQFEVTSVSLSDVRSDSQQRSLTNTSPGVYSKTIVYSDVLHVQEGLSTIH